MELQTLFREVLWEWLDKNLGAEVAAQKEKAKGLGLKDLVGIKAEPLEATAAKPKRVEPPYVSKDCPDVRLANMARIANVFIKPRKFQRKRKNFSFKAINDAIENCMHSTSTRIKKPNRADMLLIRYFLTRSRDLDYQIMAKEYGFARNYIGLLRAKIDKNKFPAFLFAKDRIAMKNFVADYKAYLKRPKFWFDEAVQMGIIREQTSDKNQFQSPLS